MKTLKYFLPLVTIYPLCSFIEGAAIPAFAADPIAQTATGQPSPTTITQSKENFVRNLAQSVLATLRDGNKSLAEKQVALQQTFTSVVDINWIARFVLGKTWNTATEEQRTRYTTLYRAYLTTTYVANFDEESAGKISDIKILGLHDADADSFAVRTEIMMADAENVHVDYLVSNDKGQYKIIDITVEGVSLLATHRSEFTELAATEGIDSIISKLQQMVNNSKSPITISMK